jgi:glycosyltransferase involved in cell wall biosynthesis
MTSYLFVHQNFPGQFLHVVRALAERGEQVVALGEANQVRQRGKPHPNMKLLGYPEPAGANPKTHHYLRSLEAHTRRGQAVFRLGQELRRKGFIPDVVVAHPGWGEALFLKDIFPRARHIQYLEYFYRTKGGDVGFDREFPAGIDDECRARMKNATQMLSFEYADAGVSPTAWQKSVYPKDWQTRIAQIHEGIDTTKAAPAADAAVTADNVRLTRSDEVLTYVARNLEPYRGFHTFMRAVPLILEQRPQAQILVVGGDGVSYGRKAPDGGSWREHLQKEWGTEVDRSRVHFLGKLPYSQYLQVLQVSSLHLYLTYPFVLSWSMLEAMSAGCVVLGSDTAPVREVIRDGENGFLTDFFAVEAMARRASELLKQRADLDAQRKAARATILQSYDLRHCLPQMLNLLGP